MENKNPVRSTLAFYIWMLHTLKNIRQNSIFYDSKSATHETFVTGKVTFRICHDEFVVTGEVKLRVFFQYAFVICFRQLLHGSCEHY